MARQRIFAGNRLRQLRSERGIRQAEFAETLGISTSYLSQIEHDDRPAIAWSQGLRASPTPAAAEVLTGQEELFAARRLAYRSEIGAPERQIEQQEQDARSTAQQREAVQRQRASIERELAGAQRLLAKGWESRTRAEQLDRQLAAVDARDAELRGALARATEGAAAARLNIEAKRSARLADIGQQLDEGRSQEAEAASLLRAASDVRDRLVVTAPQDGTVVDLRLTTPGGVLGPGDPLLDIVPVDQPLLVEVRLRPDDIESVHEGLPADVRLIAYKSGELPTFAGDLTYVSADMLADPRNGESYFLARVRLDMAELARFPRAALSPGMPAEVMIRTGERRAIDWLLAPVTDRLRRAMREE